ncbi:hypothetical protein [Arthrobacter sp. NPDC057013]|uniref:hypothetical protein n=1 Tax=Arthrobacter sp. NPDC057013 TaxID=3345999 RepID=UPI003630E0F1
MLAAEDLGKKRPKENTPGGVAGQIALARGESPHRGGRLLGMSKALVTEMPHTLTALDTGQLNGERAMYVVRETVCLTAEDRAPVDEELAAVTGTFYGVGTRGVIAAVKAAATRPDLRSVTQRASHAASERSVSLRPAPDCMTRTSSPCCPRTKASPCMRPCPGKRTPSTPPGTRAAWGRSRPTPSSNAPPAPPAVSRA